MRTHPIVEYYQALRDSAPCLSRAATLPKGTKLGLGKRRAPGNTIILSQPYRRRVSTDRLNREGSQLAASLEGEPGPTPAGKTLPHSFPETSRFRRERAREVENNQTLGEPRSTSQSTKERNGGIRREKIKTSPVNRKRRNPVWPSSCATSAGASTDLAVAVRGMATHHGFSWLPGKKKKRKKKRKRKKKKQKRIIIRWVKQEARRGLGHFSWDNSPLKKNTSRCGILQLQQQICVCDIIFIRWYMGRLVKGTKYGVISKCTETEAPCTVNPTIEVS